ncbi:MFS general substrate transporter [Ustulina deusta]|nr:MFS general substrate transporter [Ustulina deusta]
MGTVDDLTVEASSTIPRARDDSTVPPAKTVRPPRFWGTFAALCVLSFVCALDAVIITTALPTITASIGGAKEYVWIANSFIIASAGLGAGGLYVLLDIVCCDLISLRERAKFVGLRSSFAGIAAALGLALGGVIAEADWRWIFYLDIPICGVAIICILAFMRMKTGSTAQHLEGQPRFLRFHIQQAFSSNPMVPGRLFRNRTSVAGFILTFVSSALIQAVAYFLPIYFQAVLGTTATTSGTNFLPYAIGTLFFAVLGGVLLGHLGVYKYMHAASFAFAAIGFGLFTLLDSRTSKVAWAFFELILSLGLGVTISTLLPSIMAGLPESDVASITAVYVFIKTFGFVWGVTISSIIFNAAVNANPHQISDPTLRDQLTNGAAYAFASKIHEVKVSLDPHVLSEVQQVYIAGFRVIWWTGLGASLFGFFIVWLEESLELRDTLETDYGLDAQGDTTDQENVAGKTTQ